MEKTVRLLNKRSQGNTADRNYKRKRNIRIAAGLVFILGLLFHAQITVKADDTSSIGQFPEEYQEALWKLQAKYPNWIFKPVDTGLDFQQAVEAEFADNKCLIVKSADNLLKSTESGDYNAATGNYVYKDSTQFVRTQQAEVAYYMDPRNWLNEVNVLQFEQLSYNFKVHTKKGVEQILKGTFMYKTKISYITTKGKKKTYSKTYSAVIMEAARKSGVSPYYLASKIRQEIGVKGSGSSSGKYGKYVGYYNFYNIGSSDGKDPISNGLSFASGKGSYQRPWNTPMKAIIGGAQYIGGEFIKSGQDTGYFQRFNVSPDTKYTRYVHQYMTNIAGAAQETVTTYNGYSSIGTLGNTKIFLIPVYRNMPSQNNQVKISVDGTKTGTLKRTVWLQSGAGMRYGTKGISLKKGTTVTVLSGKQARGSYSYADMETAYWYRVQIKKNGNTVIGYVPANAVSLDIQKSVFLGNTWRPAIQLTTTATDAVYYLSDNPAVVSVSKTGLIRGKKRGTATIYAFTGNGSMDAVRIRVSTVVLNQSQLGMTPNSDFQLQTTVTTAYRKRKIQWTSSNKRIAAVSATGRVHAKKVGYTTITAKIKGGDTASCIVQVRPDAVRLQATTSYNRIKLKWTKSTYGAGYLIYRREAGNGSYQLIKKVKSRKITSYIDNKVETGKRYEYAIYAYCSINGKANRSAAALLQVRPTHRAVTVTETKTNYKKRSVRLYWKSMAGADGYIVERRKAGEKKYKQVQVLKGNKKTAFTDTKLYRGQNYFYRIRAYRQVDGKRVIGRCETVRIILQHI